MDTSPVDFSGDYIDSQNVIDRLEELNGLGICIDSEQREELTELTSFAAEGEYIDDWECGTILTRDTALDTDYAREYASDVGDVDTESWIATFINWDDVLEMLMQDMASATDYNGTTWYRA